MPKSLLFDSTNNLLFLGMLFNGGFTFTAISTIQKGSFNSAFTYQSLYLSSSCGKVHSLSDVDSSNILMAGSIE